MKKPKSPAKDKGLAIDERFLTDGQLVNPRLMAFVQQANIANGPQQVNNHLAREKTNSADQTISEASNGIFSDARTPCVEGATNSSMGTLEEIERSKDPTRQKKG